MVLFSSFIFVYHYRKDQFALVILKFGVEDVNDPDLLKIRLSLTGFAFTSVSDTKSGTQARHGERPRGLRVDPIWSTASGTKGGSRKRQRPGGLRMDPTGTAALGAKGGTWQGQQLSRTKGVPGRGNVFGD